MSTRSMKHAPGKYLGLSVEVSIEVEIIVFIVVEGSVALLVVVSKITVVKFDIVSVLKNKVEGVIHHIQRWTVFSKRRKQRAV